MSKFHVSLVRELRERGEHEAAAAIEAEENEAESLRAQVAELTAWKESAFSVMPDYQAIGKVIGVGLGESVHDKILPAITKLCTQLAAANKRIEDAEKQEPVAFRVDYPNADGIGMDRFFGGDSNRRMDNHLKSAEIAGIRCEIVPLYAAPIPSPSPDVTELRNQIAIEQEALAEKRYMRHLGKAVTRIAELERKLAELSKL